MSATSIEIGPPSAPLRTPSAKATATMSPMIAGPLVSRSWVSTSSPIRPSTASDTQTTTARPTSANR